MSARQVAALKDIKNFMAENRQHNLIDSQQTYKEYHDWAYSKLKGFENRTQINYHFHGDRHAYAHERYHELWKNHAGAELKAPVEIEKNNNNWKSCAMEKTGLSQKEIHDIDTNIRQKISHELGHNRVSITRAYLG